MDNQNMVYMAYDGDNAGRLCGRAILADDPNALHEVSDRINLGHEIVKKWVESHGGQFISGGGDEGVFSIPSDAIQHVEELRADYEFGTNLTATVGIGKTLSEAGKAMLVGKFRGKNTVVQYDPSIEQEIRQAQANLTQGTASAEEKKIGEAYLSQDKDPTMNQENKSEAATGESTHGEHEECPYCKSMQEEGIEDPSHCQMCHDMQEEGDDACPYCAENEEHDPNAEGHPEDCPMCREMNGEDEAPEASDDQVVPTAGPTVKNPTTTDSENYAGQDFNQPDMPKPDAIQQNPDGLGTSFDMPTNENRKLDVEGQGVQYENHNEESASIDPQSEQTAEEVVQEISAISPDQTPEASSVNQVDAANMATSSTMEGNTSRPDGFDENGHPLDMGMAEEEADEESEPGVTDLMQEGLDNHADNIQREKVVNLVAEALQGFKGCRDIIEKAKVQAPQLYGSSIAMLKAMIEMAKLLGLDKEAQADANDPLGEENPQDGSPDYEQADEGSAAPGPVGEPPQGGGSPDYEQADEGAAEAEDATDPKDKGQSASQ